MNDVLRIALQMAFLGRAILIFTYSYSMCNVPCALWIAFGEKSCEDLQQPDIVASRCLSASYCCNWCLVKTTRARLLLVQKPYNFAMVKLYGFVWFSLSDYWEGAVVWFSGSDVINCPGSRRLVCEA